MDEPVWKFDCGYTYLLEGKPMLWVQTLLCPRYHELIHDVKKKSKGKSNALPDVPNEEVKSTGNPGGPETA